jgi:ferrous iron transport protein B
MGGIILIASVIIWSLGYFPRNEQVSKHYDGLKMNVANDYNNKINNAIPDSVDYLMKEKEMALDLIEIEKESEHQQQSYIGQIGKAIEPAMQPLGFDWKMSVSLLSGIVAKEIVVSTMGVLYQADHNYVTINHSLQQKLREAVYTDGIKKGQKVISPLVAFGFIMFILIYFPCIAVVAAISRESGSWKWAIFTIFYTTALAWMVSFLVYQVGSLF